MSVWSWDMVTFADPQPEHVPTLPFVGYALKRNEPARYVKVRARDLAEAEAAIRSQLGEGCTLAMWQDRRDGYQEYRVLIGPRHQAATRIGLWARDIGEIRAFVEDRYGSGCSLQIISVPDLIINRRR